MSRVKRLLLNLLALCLGLALIPLALEIGLRFLPVFSGMPVNRASTVYSFVPYATIQRSSHWDMSNARKRQVNNAGFISDQAYDRAAQTPLIAIVGDSFIEAMQVDYLQTTEANLLTKCTPNARVYSFGAQFAPLSQYLSWVQYASQTYEPKIMVVNIVGNDFDESLLSYQLASNNGGVPGMQFFDFSTGSAELVVLPFKPEGTLTQALRHSALAQYLVRNIGIVNIVNEFRAQGFRSFFQEGKSVNISPMQESVKSADANKEYVGNAKRSFTPDKLAMSKKGVDTFLNSLPKAARLPPQSIVLTVDAERPLIYSPLGRKDLDSYFSVMREYLMQEAKKHGYLVLDLRAAMITNFDSNRQQFEFIDDNHWNANGHQLLAEQLYNVSAINRLCKNQPINTNTR